MTSNGNRLSFFLIAVIAYGLAVQTAIYSYQNNVFGSSTFTVRKDVNDTRIATAITNSSLGGGGGDNKVSSSHYSSDNITSITNITEQTKIDDTIGTTTTEQATVTTEQTTVTAEQAEIDDAKDDDEWLNLLLLTSTNASSTNTNVTLDINNITATVSRPVVVVFLSGSTANNIGKIVHGLSIALWMYNDYKVMPRMVMRHQSSSKWVKASKEVHQCFPNLRDFDFTLGNNDEYSAMINGEGRNMESKLDGISSSDERVAGKALELYMQMWTEYALNATSDIANATTVPLLISNRIAQYDFYTDKYYRQIRRFFQFDKEACCAAERPGPNDHMYHFRGFLEEMPRLGVRQGFEELGPIDVATRLFASINNSDSVVVVTPQQSSQSIVYKDYVEALKSTHNISVQTSSSKNTAMNDFCYIMQTQNEAVGYSVSTFFTWATLLGDMFNGNHASNSQTCKVRSYSIDSPNRRRRAKKVKDFSVYQKYEWNYASELKGRYCFELYQVNETFIPPVQE